MVYVTGCVIYTPVVVGVLSARMASTWETIPSVLMFECVTSAWWVTMDCTAVRHSFTDYTTGFKTKGHSMRLDVI